MRRKWVLAAGAVLALVVVGGIGGLTMRAFAGVAHSSKWPKTVTRFCVYVDGTNRGASYGDLTTRAKYGHKTCIVGKRGPAGNNSVITWNTTTSPSPTPVARRRKGGYPTGAVELAHVGPFTVVGYCSAPEGTEAVTDVISSQNGSSFAWYENQYSGNFNNGSDQQASNVASGGPNSPDFQNENYEGDFSVSTANRSTAFTGFANNGVYMNGPKGAACSFTGYLVVEK